MTTHFIDNINFLMEKMELTPFAFAERIGIDSATVYRWLDPKIQSVPRSRTLMTLGQFFGVDAERLLKERFDDATVFEINEQPKKKPPKRISGTAVPLMKASFGLTFASLFDNDVGLSREDISPAAEQWLPPAPDAEIKSESLIAIRVQGDAMAPTIQDGDLVYIDFCFGQLSDGTEETWSNNDIVLATPAHEKGEAPAPILRKLVYGDNEQDLWLTATNPDFPGTRTVKASIVLGKVVAIFRKL